MQSIRARCLRPCAGQAISLAVCQLQTSSARRLSCLGNFTHGQTVAPERRRRRRDIPVASEASCLAVTAVVVVAGASTTLGYLALRKSRSGNDEASLQDKQTLEIIDARDFRLLHKKGNSVTFGYAGSDARYQRTTLRCRVDDDNAIASDKAAALLLGRGLISDRELVVLEAGVASAVSDCLSSSSSAPSRRGQVAALKLNTAVPVEARQGPVVTVELQPGSGVVDLYGVPSSFRVQENSGLRKDSLGRTGKYNPRDMYSGRPDRVRRALHALSEDPEDGLRVLVDDVCILSGSSEGALPERLREEVGIEGGLGALLELLAECLDREGQALLMALLRAQCSAGTTTTNQAHQLYQVLRQRAGPLKEGSLASPEALESAFARGFWSLPANESGKDTREREGVLLLERARRELWVQGSASRRELEAQIRVFLCRNLLGRAANIASLQLKVVRARPQHESAIRNLGFIPAAALGHGLWCRLDLVDLELPLESILCT